MAAMPQPGDRYAQAFIVEPGQFWAMVHDRQGRPPTAPRSPHGPGGGLSSWWLLLVAGVGVSRSPGRADGVERVLAVAAIEQLGWVRTSVPDLDAWSPAPYRHLYG